MIFWLERVAPRLNFLWQGDWEAGTIEPDRSLYDHELVLVTKGTCVVEIARRTWRLSAGSYIIVPPGVRHVSVAEENVHRQCVHFDWIAPLRPKPHPTCCFYPNKADRRMLTRAPAFIPAGILHGRYSQLGPLPGLLDVIFEQWRSTDRFDRALGRAGFLQVLVHLLQSPRRQKGSRDRATFLAQEVKNLLDRRSDESVGVQDLLRTVGFSYPHLCRIFHQQFGLTPVEYRNAKRLERARTLLRNSRLTIAEVAFAAGFSDPGYFSRKFRQQNGVAPSVFR